MLSTGLSREHLLPLACSTQLSLLSTASVKVI